MCRAANHRVHGIQTAPDRLVEAASTVREAIDGLRTLLPDGAFEVFEEKFNSMTSMLGTTEHAEAKELFERLQISVLEQERASRLFQQVVSYRAQGVQPSREMWLQATARVHQSIKTTQSYLSELDQHMSASLDVDLENLHECASACHEVVAELNETYRPAAGPSVSP